MREGPLAKSGGMWRPWRTSGAVESPLLCRRNVHGQAAIFSLFWLFVGARVASVALWGRYATPGHLWGPCGAAGGRGEAQKSRYELG